MSELKWDDFPDISSKQWKQKIQAALKGADYNETLLWKTPEGIDVKPFYTSEDSPGMHIPANQHNWKICQEIYVDDVHTANTEALNALSRGTESLLFIIPSEDCAVESLLKGIDLAAVPVHFQPEFLSENFIKRISAIASETATYFHLNTDSIGHLTRSGNWYTNPEKDNASLSAILKHSGNFKTTISVDASLYQNAGATIVQQLAYALAHANEYCNFITAPELSSGTPENFGIQFKTAIGGNYFFEIAKLRALRLLWATLAEEYDLPRQCFIFAMPSRRNKTLYDYNVNMLRTTTECMSAVLGGADTVCNLPYDAVYHKNNEFGTRVARNQLLILKHESYFDKVSNPAEGAYYIESITRQLAEKALDIFKQIEAGGGFLTQLKSHSIQQKIKESAASEQQLFNEAEYVLIGTNKYPNENDNMMQDLEIDPFVKTDVRKTLIEPVIEKRLAEETERQRLKEETHK